MSLPLPLPLLPEAGTAHGAFSFSSAFEPYIIPTAASWKHCFSLLYKTVSELRLESLSAAHVADRASYLFFLVSHQLSITYRTCNPAVTAGFIATVLLPVYLFSASTITGNVSYVDRLWGFLPMFYTLHFLFWGYLNGLPVAPVGLMAGVVLIWALRLTFNYYRKGGFSPGAEDYRWEIIRKRTNSIGFAILNITFISTIQSVLLYAVSLPAYFQLIASQGRSQLSPPSGLDIGFAATLLAILGLETIADNQQWAYQTVKSKFLKTAKAPPASSRYSIASIDLGFCTHGLWAYSRHPNFLAEQAFWVVFSIWGFAIMATSNPSFVSHLKTILLFPLQFTVHFNTAAGTSAATSSPILTLPSLLRSREGASNSDLYDSLAAVLPPAYSLVGPFVYLSVFFFSTILTEDITASKYPAYPIYQACVGKFCPRWWRSTYFHNACTRVSHLTPRKGALLPSLPSASSWFWTQDVTDAIYAHQESEYFRRNEGKSHKSVKNGSSDSNPFAPLRPRLSTASLVKAVGPDGSLPRARVGSSKRAA